MTDFKDIMGRIENERAAKAEECENTRMDLARAMHACGVLKAAAYFSGCGDEGSIYSIEFEMRAGVEEPDDARKKFADWCYKYLEGTGVDWYNNDGGNGEIAFDLSTPAFEFAAEVNQNETVSHTVVSEQGPM